MPTDYCNMNCVYCFNDRRTKKKEQVMSVETVEKIFSIIIPFYESVVFIWHGGEPTSLGIEFYKIVIELQNKYREKYDCKIQNIMQSNLTLLDERLVSFLLDNSFRIGGSYDGCCNDETRGSSSAILRGHRLIEMYGGRNSFISVISSKNIHNLINDYLWFKKENINYSTNIYISSYGKKDPLFIPEEEFVQEYIKFFDYWVNDTKCNIKIRNFETVLNHIIYNYSSMCSYTSCLGKWVGIHYDGKIYPCNRSFPIEYCFGNISDYEDIRQCFESQSFLALTEKAVERRKKCANCELFSFCAGGCNNNAYVFGGIENNNHYFCRILRPIYAHIKETTKKISEMDEKEKEAINPIVIEKLKKGVKQNERI